MAGKCILWCHGWYINGADRRGNRGRKRHILTWVDGSEDVDGVVCIYPLILHVDEMPPAEYVGIGASCTPGT
jgi:hypothetical protein